MSMNSAREVEKEHQRLVGLHRHLALLKKQEQEMTPGMLEFCHAQHSIKIEEDKGGFLTCRIRDRATQRLLHRVRFQKQPRHGVVYTFLDVQRLSFLAFSLETLQEIQQATT